MKNKSRILEKKRFLKLEHQIHFFFHSIFFISKTSIPEITAFKSRPSCSTRKKNRGKNEKKTLFSLENKGWRKNHHFYKIFFLHPLFSKLKTVFFYSALGFFFSPTISTIRFSLHPFAKPSYNIFHLHLSFILYLILFYLHPPYTSIRLYTFFFCSPRTFFYSFSIAKSYFHIFR